jgi:dihydrofolate reductase
MKPIGLIRLSRLPDGQSGSARTPATTPPLRSRTTPTKELRMGGIVITEFVSLDGVVEDPGTAGDFRHRGWSFEFDRGPEGDAFKLDEARDSTALLLGRVTYETFAANWPNREGELADKLNSMPKYVVSSTLERPKWANTTVVTADDLVEAVAHLKNRLEGDVVVHGSVRLAQALLEQDFVDELRLMVYPVLLGAGRRMFSDRGEKKTLRLVESRAVGDGVMILTYAPQLR